MGHIPRIDNPTEVAAKVVGREVRVGIRSEMAPGIFGSGGGLELIRETIRQTMEHVGVVDENAARLCETTALGVLGNLMLKDGITVDFGSYDKPEETIAITLREAGPRHIEAGVQRTTQ